MDDASLLALPVLIESSVPVWVPGRACSPLTQFAVVTVFIGVIIVRARGFANAQGAWHVSWSRRADMGKAPDGRFQAGMAAGGAGMPLEGDRALYSGNSSPRPVEGMRPAMSAQQGRMGFERRLTGEGRKGKGVS